jgi:peptidoglycan/LPS O-acetylase OafA/YrhL
MERAYRDFGGREEEKRRRLPLQELPVLRFPGKCSVVPHFILSTMLLIGVAMVSWHCIEKPVRRIRKEFSFTARKGDAVQCLPEGGAAT